MPRTPRPIPFLLAVFLAANVGAEGQAQSRKAATPRLPRPELKAVVPAGLRAGTAAAVEVRGADLDGLTALWFDHPGLTALPNGAGTFRVTCAPDTPPGHHDIRTVGRFGLSNPRAFVVGDRPEGAETEPNDTPARANLIAVNSVVNGVIARTADVDIFAFDGKRGQRVFAELEAERIDSRLDGTLRLEDPSGREIAESRDAEGFDPLIDATLPRDGRYTLKLHDVTYRGSDDCPYRLTLTDGPHLDATSPALARPGESATFTVFGRNLGGEPAPGLSLAGRPLERKSVTVTVPGQLAEVDPENPGRTLIRSPAAARRGFEFRLDSPSGRSNPVFLSWADDPIIAEPEPTEGARVVTLPCAIAGAFETRNDTDVYRFQARRGQAVWVEATAEGIGSPADPGVVIQQVSATGSVRDLMTLEDQLDRGDRVRFGTASVDASGLWIAPEDGTYQAVVTDLFGSQRGDPRLTYRLSLRAPRPDFTLVLVPGRADRPEGLNVPAGGRALAYVLALRADGFAGPIRVEALGLPPGVSCPPVVIPAGRNAAPIVFETEPGALRTPFPFRLLGRTRSDGRKDSPAAEMGLPPAGQDIAHEVLAGGMVCPPPKGTPAEPGEAPARLWRGLVLCVTDPEPLTLRAAGGTTTANPGGQVVIDLAVTRAAGFNGAVTVTLDNPPPGLDKPPVVTIAPGATQGQYTLALPKELAPGVYSLVLKGESPYPFNKDPNAKDQPNVTLGAPANPVTVRVVAAPGPLR